MNVSRAARWLTSRSTTDPIPGGGYVELLVGDQMAIGVNHSP